MAGPSPFPTVRMDWTKVEGWLTEEEGAALQALARGKDVLELGSWKGRSTACMAATAKSVLAVDHFRGDADTGAADTLEAFLANTERFANVSHCITASQEYRQKTLPETGDRFDLTFVDGQHDADSVEHDTRLAIEATRPGGVIAWHDWNYPTVREGAARCGYHQPDGTAGALAWATAKPRVFVALPFCGPVPLQAALNAPIPTHGGVHVVDFKAHAISSLVHCFNCLWVEGLNLRDRNEATHFAMIHSDTQPEPGWCDRLWEQMRTRPGCAAISAVSCIKEQDSNPRMSTAYAPQGYRWGVSRFVHHKDRATLPVTFGPETAGPDEQLLINTGCMLIDLTHPVWAEFPGWEQPIKVDRNDNGVWQAAFEPEDWRMSRFLAERGVDYAATWGAKVVHHGSAEWPNH